jgi:hypothetical protein
MSDIDKQAKDMFEKLSNSSEMRSIFKDKDRKIEFKPVMAGLRKIKPTK